MEAHIKRAVMGEAQVVSRRGSGDELYLGVLVMVCA